MAALLVALSVMAVLMSAAMPVWKHQAQREKEEELIFRGSQYARAVGLFQRRAGPGVLPPSLDVLVQQKFLRKKYKDPITNDDFDLVRGSVQAAAQPGQQTQAQNPAGGGLSSNANPQTQGGAARATNTPNPAVAAGISGVVSKSKNESIRLYNGRNHYNEWAFVYVQPAQAPGGGRGTAAPGQQQQQPGAQPQAPGGFGGVAGGGGRQGQPGRGAPGGTGVPAGRGGVTTPGGQPVRRGP